MCPDVAGGDDRRTYWGVRPLYAPDEADRGDARAISRGFAVLDHAADGVDGFYTAVGGKLTTCRLMAEATADRVCARLGVDAPCLTAERPLPGHDDPARLDALGRSFAVDAPADGRGA
jgi:glycerol-3-phosphate dehydrogenase